MYEELAVLAVFAFLYSLISGRIEKLPVSGPMIFVVAGFLLGPLGLGWFEDKVTLDEARFLVDVTLALILFIDAANAETSVLRRFLKIPSRMLLLGLPGAIALGFAVAAVMFGNLTLFEAAILGTMLAATDAALGKAVITNEAVPPRLREALNFESGFNDGLCVPVLLVFVALAHGHAESGLALELVAEEIGIGAAVGLGVAAGGAWLLKRYANKGWVNKVWVQISVPTLAIACFAIAQSLHGSGYIAAFTGGILFGFVAKDATHKLVMPGEGIAEAMAMLTWLLFGLAIIGQVAQSFTWEIIVFAVLSLTVVRIVPIFLSLTGTGEDSSSKLFLGWFGPRGLASIVFAIIVYQENLPGSEYIALVVACTVGLSLVAHGVTANPMARWIAKKERPATGGT
jgi:NhaP-type Na+/H+ or K+/H+ antiporter